MFYDHATVRSCVREDASSAMRITTNLAVSGGHFRQACIDVELSSESSTIRWILSETGFSNAAKTIVASGGFLTHYNPPYVQTST